MNGVFDYRNLTNARIFREIKSQDRKFPDRIFQDGKFWDQKIPGIPIFHGIQEFFFGENSRIFFFRGQKIPGFLAPLFSRIENSVTEFPRTFLAIFWLFWAKQDKTPPGEFGGEFGFSLRGH